MVGWQTSLRDWVASPSNAGSVEDGTKGKALERSPVGGTALCDVVVRRGLCAREGENLVA